MRRTRSVFFWSYLEGVSRVASAAINVMSFELIKSIWMSNYRPLLRADCCCWICNKETLWCRVHQLIGYFSCHYGNYEAWAKSRGLTMMKSSNGNNFRVTRLLALCAGNSLVTGEFPSQRPVTRSFDVSFDVSLNKPLSKQSWGWWFETLSRPFRATLYWSSKLISWHCGEIEK